MCKIDMTSFSPMNYSEMATSIKGENLRHDHVLITVNIFSIKRK